MQKTIRFGDLVRNSGRPQTMTLWSDPKKDPSLQEAIEKNRMLTVIQEPTSSHKEFGRIGFHQQPHALYLVFPRSLPEDTKASRVIGINYQLLEEPVVSNPVQTPDFATKPGPPRHAPTKAPVTKIERPKLVPVMKSFTIKVRQTATLDTEINVEAVNRANAEKEALETVKQRPFDLSKATLTQKIMKIRN